MCVSKFRFVSGWAGGVAGGIRGRVRGKKERRWWVSDIASLEASVIVLHCECLDSQSSISLFLLLQSILF